MVVVRKSTTLIALEELKKRDQLESLRQYLIVEKCFPVNKDPSTSPITIDELKKLVRAWKLNERRNFWKTHPEKEDIINALIQHSEQLGSYYLPSPPPTAPNPNSSSLSHSHNHHGSTSQPNLGRKGSIYMGENIENKNASLRPMPPNEFKPSRKQIKNYCGLKYFNREVNQNELMLASRFYNYPSPDERVVNVVNKWRSEDYYMKEEADSSLAASSSSSMISNNSSNYKNDKNDINNTNLANSSLTKAQIAAKNRTRILKQRNLSLHLMNFSAFITSNNNNQKSPSVSSNSTVFPNNNVSNSILTVQSPLNLTVKSVQTFIYVADSDDSQTVNNCIIAISNIASHIHVRNILLEINVMHKLTNMLQYIKGDVSQWAAALLFYYFSCDKESEDRIYNACSSLLQVNSLLKIDLNSSLAQQNHQQELRFLALYTLNNLMPCIDRHRVAELIMKSLLSQFIETDSNKILSNPKISSLYLTIIMNMSWFTNVHNTLLHLGVFELLEKFAQYACSNNNSEISFAIVRILLSFLQLPEQAHNIINQQFLLVLILLFQSHHDLTLLYAFKVSVILSSVPKIRNVLRESKLIETICSKLLYFPSIKNEIALEAAKFFNNISIDLSSENSKLLIDQMVPDAILVILENKLVKMNVKSMAIRALQNIVADRYCGISLAGICVRPLLPFINPTSPDLGAIEVLYNLSCIPQCRNELVENNIHIQALECLVKVKDSKFKSSFLQILVQLSSSEACILSLLELNLIKNLEEQLKNSMGNEVWKDVSLMLLAIVAYASSNLSDKDKISILHILKIICINNAEIDIIENCAQILKFLSILYHDFEELNPVLISLFQLEDNDEINDNLSHVLYNMTCNKSNINLMLKDSLYINIMIRLMRNGKIEVQENIVHGMRTLCAEEKCSEIMLSKDMLSDLVVIGLLRTSSEDVKISCSEAFYNMLCHKKTRLALLKGDLWWALMRLGRTDSIDIRLICVRVIADLAVPVGYEHSSLKKEKPDEAEEEKKKLLLADLEIQKQTIKALRHHHVLSFMKDLSTASSPEVLIKCLEIVHNLLNQFSTLDSEHPIAVHEAASAIRIAADAFNRAPSLQCIRYSTLILLKCAQWNVEGSHVEYLTIDLIEIFRITSEKWCKEMDCCLLISRLLYELSKNSVIKKSTHVSDLSPVFSSCLQSGPSMEICENILAALYQFVLTENTSASEIIRLPIWPILLKESLSIETMTIPRPSQTTNLFSPARKSFLTPRAPPRSVNDRTTRPSIFVHSPYNNDPSTPGSNGANAANGAPGSVGNNGNGQNTHSTLTPEYLLNDEFGLKGSQPHPFRIQGIALSLLSYVSDELLAQTPESLSSSILTGIIRNEDLIDSPLTRSNYLNLLYKCSFSSKVINSILISESFTALLRFLTQSIGTSKQDKAVEFTSTFLRNISLHSTHISKLITINSVMPFIKEICESITENSALDLAIFFYNISNYLIQNDNFLNPKFVLDCIQDINKEITDDNSLIININKYTISIILNKYTFINGVDPIFIQNMFTYMNTNIAVIIPEKMKEITFKTLDEINYVLINDFLLLKESSLCQLLLFEGNSTQWKPILNLSIKQQGSIILKFSNASSLKYDKIETLELFQVTLYSKIIKTYDSVKNVSINNSMSLTESQIIIENENENDEELDNEGEKELKDEKEKEFDLAELEENVNEMIKSTSNKDDIVLMLPSERVDTEDGIEFDRTDDSQPESSEQSLSNDGESETRNEEYVEERENIEERDYNDEEQHQVEVEDHDLKDYYNNLLNDSEELDSEENKEETGEENKVENDIYDIDLDQTN